MDCSPPGSSVHGILQARTLDWVVISSSRESSWPRDRTQVSCIAGGFFTIWATGNKIWNQLSQKEGWWEGEHLDLRFTLLFTTVRRSCGKYTYHSMESSQKVAAELKGIVTAFSVLLQTSKGHISPLRAPFRGWYLECFDRFRVLHTRNVVGGPLPVQHASQGCLGEGCVRSGHSNDSTLGLRELSAHLEPLTTASVPMPKAPSSPGMRSPPFWISWSSCVSCCTHPLPSYPGPGDEWILPYCCLLCECVTCSVVSDSLWPHGL